MLKKHHMDRRTFLGWAAGAGLVLTAPPLALRARAGSEAFEGPFWMFIHCSGGWDPTLLCDPKGRDGEDDPAPVNHFDRDEIETTGPFTHAPVDGHRAFFQRFQDELLVINGVDTQTNSHEVGTRHTWSGSMDMDTPSLAGLVAGLAAQRPSLAFLSNGGYDLTGGLVAPTRLGDTDTLLSLAYPDRLDANSPTSALFPQSSLDRLALARAARLDRQIEAASLPRYRKAWSLLRDARLGDNELAALAETLPDDLDDGSDLRRQAQVAMACFAAGVTMSATLEIGGFDTHGDHDDSHTPQLQELLDAISFAMDEAERHGIREKVILVVGSDFGRTPWYNEGDGKDHWPITSMLLMGPGIRGGRVVGATDNNQVPLLLDPVTLRTAEMGVRVTPADIHADLRALAGIHAHPQLASWSVGTPYGLLG
jgi:uncharacterized protein (DUF1501 family)